MAGLTGRDRLRPEASLDATDGAVRVGAWGFLAHSDLPDGPGPAFLLVALRATPTLQHFDPESVDYWVTERDRGERRTLTHATTMPRSEDFAWGPIRLVDRFGISNEYLAFGGHLDAASVDDVVIAAFASPAPLLRCGGHSQAVDPGADAVGAFFARLMVGIDFKPGFEADMAQASPLVLYAAFIRDGLERRKSAEAAEAMDDELGRMLRADGLRLRAADPESWAAAGDLLAAASAV